MLLAQAVVAGYGILTWILIIVAFAAIIAIAIAAIKYFEVKIPPIVVTIFWILVVAVVAILAIKLIWSLIF